MFYVYRITNQKGEYFYIGITQDIVGRLRRHNDGSTRSTKPYRPFSKIIVLKTCFNRKEARRWEKYFKSGAGREKLKKIE